MNKKELSERDICTKFITPALRSAGWNEQTQLREEVTFTKDRVIVRGRMVSRGKAKRADYVLYFKPNIPLAVIEAKDNHCSVGDGIQQAPDYASHAESSVRLLLQRRRVRLPRSHGHGRVIETNLSLDDFPSPATLWARYRDWQGLPPEADDLVLQDYFSDGSRKGPRYYQATGVNAATEPIAKGQQRLLLAMATGTGKTYTAFQIIWRLWKAGRKKRVGPDDTYTSAAYLIRLRLPLDLVNPLFLNLAMNAPYFRETQIQPQLQQQCGQANVNGTKLRGMLVPVAPVAEQQRTVDMVQKITAICDRLEAQLATARTESSRLLEAVLHRALEETGASTRVLVAP
jgi:hypothetical protein